VDAAGFTPTFVISFVLAIGMFGILIFFVKDPRKNRSLTTNER
jgi:hypothetical protein